MSGLASSNHPDTHEVTAEASEEIPALRLVVDQTEQPEVPWFQQLAWDRMITADKWLPLLIDGSLPQGCSSTAADRYDPPLEYREWMAGVPVAIPA